MATGTEDFEEQFRQEALAREAEAVQAASGENEFTVGGKLFRKDADGTVFEFDSEKKAWFPKVRFTAGVSLCD